MYCNDSVIVANLWHLLEKVNHAAVASGISAARIARSKAMSYESLQAILNSNILRFVTQELTYDGTHFYPNHMKMLPIPNLEPEIAKELHRKALLAREFEDSADSDNLKAIAVEIDDLVAQSFGLTQADVSLILDSMAAFPNY
jgi:hypothetical protein